MTVITRFARTARTTILAIAVALASATASCAGTVLFDQGHGQKFLVDRPGPLQLSDFADAFRAAGMKVTTTREPLSAKVLAGADILILAGPFTPYTPEEVAAIGRFLSAGGRVVALLHIGIPFTRLFERLDIDFSNAPIREAEGIIGHDPMDFRVTRLSSHPLFTGLGRFSAYGVWALRPSGKGEVLAVTSPGAWIDLNGSGRLDAGDARQSFAVAVTGRFGSGRFVVFGDDAIFQNRFQDRDNARLARNLALWLR